MAKININFNNTEYSIDESALSAATANLQSHLSTSMNGSGAVINLGGISYNIDSTKLSDATNNFVSHLRTIAGSGSKVVVGGVEYSIDSTKMANVVSDLETVFGNLQTGIRLEAGLYDANDNLLASWDTLVNTYGLDCEKTYYHDGPTDPQQLKTVLINNGLYDAGKKMVIGNITSIGAGAFRTCENLADITIPSSVTNIGSSAFYDCSGLTSITIPDSVTSIGSMAFHYCRGLTNITISNSITSIRNSTFEGCRNLTEITIPDGVTTIGGSAFNGCTGLASVTIPDGVTSIGEYAFKNCPALTSATIPDSVTDIGRGAYSDCTGLTEITFNGTIEQWDVITKGSDWNKNVPATYAQCSDGTRCFSQICGTCTVCVREEADGTSKVLIKTLPYESVYNLFITHKETGVDYGTCTEEGVYIPAGTYILKSCDSEYLYEFYCEDKGLSISLEASNEGSEFELVGHSEYRVSMSYNNFDFS
jgi:hypothetical protein